MPTGLSAPNVLDLSHRLKVKRVHASSVATEVIELHPYRHVTDKRFVRDSMRENDPAPRPPKPPIPE
jgi:hypothetical protein